MALSKCAAGGQCLFPSDPNAVSTSGFVMVADLAELQKVLSGGQQQQQQQQRRRRQQQPQQQPSQVCMMISDKLRFVHERRCTERLALPAFRSSKASNPLSKASNPLSKASSPLSRLVSYNGRL
jgi:hypothetical protein